MILYFVTGWPWTLTLERQLNQSLSPLVNSIEIASTTARSSSPEISLPENKDGTDWGAGGGDTCVSAWHDDIEMSVVHWLDSSPFAFACSSSSFWSDFGAEMQKVWDSNAALKLKGPYSEYLRSSKPIVPQLFSVLPLFPDIQQGLYPRSVKLVPTESGRVEGPPTTEASNLMLVRRIG